MSGPFPEGSYRRRIRLVATGLGEVEGGLEDDFHHFEVTIRCDDEQVTDVEGRARRWPWTTCPDAAVPLRQLEGMPLSMSCLAVGDRADPKANCTHMFDLAGLAVAHAARGGPLGTTRQYDVEIPAGAQMGGEVVVRLWRDGQPLLWWALDGRTCVAPEPYASAPWKGGFFRWAAENLDDDAAEAAIVLRRACDIGMGRGMDLDAVDAAEEMRPLMLGVCFTMQPEQIQVALREKGTARDFDEHPDRLLRD
jgi:hypothetical protein